MFPKVKMIKGSNLIFPRRACLPVPRPNSALQYCIQSTFYPRVINCVPSLLRFITNATDSYCFHCILYNRNFDLFTATNTSVHLHWRSIKPGCRAGGLAGREAVRRDGPSVICNTKTPDCAGKRGGGRCGGRTAQVILFA